jgi:NAD(P)-dependent dehydrogenase (short-subunit alcohol dehydrogenase family)
MRFLNQHVVVTGGTSGIGYAIAAALIAEGARVTITGQDHNRVAEAAGKLGSRAIGVVADQSIPNGHAALLTSIGAEGRIDGLILNAGVTMPSATADETEAQFDRQMAINTKGPFFSVKALAPHLKDGGTIVVNTSCLDQLGMPGMAVYAASKAALRSLVRTWAAEFLPRKIRVNAVAPGPVNTPIYGKLGLPPEHLGAMAEGIRQKVPMGRFATSSEMAGPFLFLASAEASFITGVELAVDGGWTQL